MISIDTMILARAFRQDEPAYRAYIDNCVSEGHRLMIAAPALAEYLVKIPAAGMEEEVARLSQVFEFHPLDVRSAILAAKLWSNRQAMDELREGGATRTCLNADCHILAISVVAGAEKLATDDDDFRVLCGLLEVEIELEKPLEAEFQANLDLDESDQPEATN